jgi:hypothetical protein
MVQIMPRIYLILSLRVRLTISHPHQAASTQNTVPPPVSVETHVDSSAQTDSRLSHLATRLRAYAVRLRSSVTGSAWLQDHAYRSSQFVGRRAGLAAAFLQTWDLGGWPAASLVVCS